MLLRRRASKAIAARQACLGLGAALLWAGCAGPTATPTAIPTDTATATASPTATPTATATATPFPQEAFVVGADRVALRAGPDPLHPAVGGVARATPMAIRGRNDDASWFAVRLADASEGWIGAAGIRVRRSLERIPLVATPSPPPSPTPTATPTATAAPMDPALPLVVAPPVVAQGDPFVVRLRQPGIRQANATLDGLEIALRDVGGDTFAGLMTAGLDTNPGEHAVHVTLIDGDGNAASQAVPLRVRDARYRESTEAIRLDAAKAGEVLDTAAADAENARLAGVWTSAITERLWSGAWLRPVTGTVTSPFGGYRDYNAGSVVNRHTGLDLRGRRGTPVLAPAHGRVALAEPLQVRGNTVWLDHGWGVYSGYFHLDAITSRVGDVVEPGTPIGMVGATGRATAPHLHWEVRIHGLPSNPSQWLLRDVGGVP